MLTPKREKYVQGLHKGLSQRKAYREAYPSSRKWKDSTVDKRASELYLTREIQGRLQELKEKDEKEIREQKLWSFEKSVTGLMWIMQKSQKDIEHAGVRTANSKAFIDALKELNDLLGYGLERETKINLDKARIEKIKAETDKLKGIAEEIEDLEDIEEEIYGSKED
ncbi:hypothetical protein [uncultured Anaerococcus sp.]|uniref:hypothetical protein n=1 Tax=uncultured Anaerococcus sp. TaxID=293428 RepID=UPI002607491E|nr:hypothetical protein [uncultured Anaerococcus sp.]